MEETRTGVVRRTYDPALGLTGNLRMFCASLREEGLLIGTGEVIDSLYAIERVDICDPQECYLTLRVVLCSRYDDLAIFDRAFRRFVRELAGEGDEPLIKKRERSQDDVNDEMGGHHSLERNVDKQEDSEGTRSEKGMSGELTKEQSAVTASAAAAFPTLNPGGATVLRASYSPDDKGVSTGVNISLAQMDDFLSAVDALLASVHLGPSRRWRPMPQGGRLDFRRTVRRSLELGGDFASPSWYGHPRRRARFVLLLDSSRSMAGYRDLLLQFACALIRRSRRAEVFAFSTRLNRITHELRTRSVRFPTPSSHFAAEWGGGTRIGACLQAFVRQYGRKFLTPDTVVLIVSDGLDTGDREGLSWAMRRLHRRSARVVWLNPLLATEGYEPRAAGMKAALPFIDTFVELSHPASLRKLAAIMASRKMK